MKTHTQAEEVVLAEVRSNPRASVGDCVSRDFTLSFGQVLAAILNLLDSGEIVSDYTPERGPFYRVGVPTA